jgi:GT2 family glycosyltransferase
MLIKRSLFLKLGGFNEGLFMWGEDAELALRLNRLGHKTRELSLGLKHIGGHSVSELTDRRSKAFYIARNRLFILRSMFTLKYRTLHLPIVLIAMLVNAFTRKAMDRTLFAYLKGILAGLAPIPKTLSPRQGLSD